ncbi:hypothetical protein SAMN04489740_4268 [Arthrobacter alpinus]|uniref:Uncharacterized protein n=1 Tax=Arthrobacter alpinus TaxID=656366 RepID=A0A1H5PG09_9MICC|nr:hypothetical protein [Arthrobacter alpinus]SEF12636.1 hypothetical protein SAMN04489740_4268 [Arthrobacter alpinus]
MKTWARGTIVGAMALGLAAGGFGIANALWSTSVSISAPEISTGSVRFAAQTGHEGAVPVFSDGGTAVTLALPGSTVIEVLGQEAVDPAPVIWRFTASGSALGIAGVDYTVSVREQNSSGTSHDLSSGHAMADTVLKGSTLKIYRAAAGGDCSAVPATPNPVEGEEARNVYLFEADGVQLQAPGTAQDGRVSEQEWCVSLQWNAELDGLYVNDVQVTGTAEDGSTNGAMASWHAPVGFPPSLDMLGTYRNLGLAEGTAEDSTLAKASSEWFADVYPDPSGEPDIVIALDPIITNANPAVNARD